MSELLRRITAGDDAESGGEPIERSRSLREAIGRDEGRSLFGQFTDIVQGAPAGLINLGKEVGSDVITSISDIPTPILSGVASIAAGKPTVKRLTDRDYRFVPEYAKSMGRTLTDVGELATSLAPGGLRPQDTEYGKAVRDSQIVGKILEDVGNLAVVGSGAGRAVGYAGKTGGRLATTGSKAADVAKKVESVGGRIKRGGQRVDAKVGEAMLPIIPVARTVLRKTGPGRAVHAKARTAMLRRLVEPGTLALREKHLGRRLSDVELAELSGRIGNKEIRGLRQEQDQKARAQSEAQGTQSRLLSDMKEPGVVRRGLAKLAGIEDNIGKRSRNPIAEMAAAAQRLGFELFDKKTRQVFEERVLPRLQQEYAARHADWTARKDKARSEGAAFLDPEPVDPGSSFAEYVGNTYKITGSKEGDTARLTDEVFERLDEMTEGVMTPDERAAKEHYRREIAGPRTEQYLEEVVGQREPLSEGQLVTREENVSRETMLTVARRRLETEARNDLDPLLDELSALLERQEKLVGEREALEVAPEATARDVAAVAREGEAAGGADTATLLSSRADINSAQAHERMSAAEGFAADAEANTPDALPDLERNGELDEASAQVFEDEAKREVEASAQAEVIGADTSPAAVQELRKAAAAKFLERADEIDAELQRILGQVGELVQLPTLVQIRQMYDNQIHVAGNIDNVNFGAWSGIISQIWDPSVPDRRPRRKNPSPGKKMPKRKPTLNAQKLKQWTDRVEEWNSAARETLGQAAPSVAKGGPIGAARERGPGFKGDERLPGQGQDPSGVANVKGQYAQIGQISELLEDLQTRSDQRLEWFDVETLGFEGLEEVFALFDLQDTVWAFLDAGQGRSGQGGRGYPRSKNPNVSKHWPDFDGPTWAVLDDLPAKDAEMRERLGEAYVDEAERLGQDVEGDTAARADRRMAEVAEAIESSLEPTGVQRMVEEKADAGEYLDDVNGFGWTEDLLSTVDGWDFYAQVLDTVDPAKLQEVSLELAAMEREGRFKTSEEADGFAVRRYKEELGVEHRDAALAVMAEKVARDNKHSLVSMRQPVRYADLNVSQRKLYAAIQRKLRILNDVAEAGRVAAETQRTIRSLLAADTRLAGRATEAAAAAGRLEKHAASKVKAADAAFQGGTGQRVFEGQRAGARHTRERAARLDTKVADTRREVRSVRRRIERIRAANDYRLKRALEDVESQPARFRPVLTVAQAVRDQLLESASLLGEDSVAYAELVRAVEELPATLKEVVDAGIRVEHRPGGPLLGGAGGAPVSPAKGSLKGDRRRLTAQTDLSIEFEMASAVSDLGVVYRNRAVDMVLEAGFVLPAHKLTDQTDAVQISTELAEHGLVPYDPTNAWGDPNPSVGSSVTPETLFIPKRLRRELNAYFGPSGSLERFLAQNIDPATRLWKGSVLALMPRWHVGNMIGNMILVTAAGGVPPWRTLGYMRQGLQEIHRRQYGGKSDLPEELAIGSSHEGDLSIDDVKRAQDLRPGDEVREPQRIRRMIGNRLPDAVNSVTERSYRFNQTVDNLSRTVVFLDAKNRRGMAEGEAVAHALRSVGDFSNMTHIERSYIRRVVPFYAWIRHMSRVSTRLAFTHPGRAALALGLANAWMPEEYEGAVPFLEGAYPVGDDKFMQFGNMWPYGNLANLDWLKEIDPSNPLSLLTATGRAVTGNINPVLEFPIEAAFGSTFDKAGLRPLRSGTPQRLDEYGRELPQPTTESRGAFQERAGNLFPQARFVRDQYRALSGGALIRSETGDVYPDRWGRPIPTGDSKWAPLAGLVGVPVPKEADVRGTLQRTADRREAFEERKERLRRSGGGAGSSWFGVGDLVGKLRGG